MSTGAATRGDGREFDRVAGDYDRVRPTYPDELVDRACQIAGLAPGDRVLEVGCGTGQLTQSLVARGLNVTAIDRGANLLALARRRARLGPAEFVNARFEDAMPSGGRFRAVFSASAFHWIDPDVSWRRAADLLEPAGTLALIQYCGLQEESSRSDHAALLGAMARVAPELAARWPPLRDLAAIEAGARQRSANVSEVWSWVAGHDVARAQAAALFGEAELTTAVPRVIEQTADELNGLMRTTSFYLALSPAQRSALERESVALQERVGRPIRSGMIDVLVTARTRAP
ncbi:MAG TPA: methyltransferase domain-containing protein [Solirubrobacteraceae bacterium]|nr:methyltransferase domain-containing protein [Solirubrobacteraceae bacterium]